MHICTIQKHIVVQSVPYLPHLPHNKQRNTKVEGGDASSHICASVLGQAGCLCVSPHGQGVIFPQKLAAVLREKPPWAITRIYGVPFQAPVTYFLLQHPKSPPPCKSVPNPPLPLLVCGPGASCQLLPQVEEPKTFHPRLIRLQCLLYTSVQFNSRTVFVFDFVTAVVVALKRPFVGLGYGHSPPPSVGVSK